MSETSINILIGGEAGQGLATIGQLMTKALVRGGYHVLVNQDYMSRIRGGHNFFAIRTGPEPIHSAVEAVDILVALNEETIELHKPQLTERAIVVADESLDCSGLNALKVPFKELAPKPLFHNVVALGVLGSSICSDIGILEKLLRETFGKKGDEIVDANLDVLRNAYNWVKEQEFDFACMPPAEENAPERIMINGNEAIAMGALAAGANFLSFYPMTPSTSVALTLINKGAKLGLVAEQVEDEIAAMNMALGASWAGARSIVTTSGGGFALMVEGISLAGITETPVVTILVQRPGPATGLPTRTEQADLNLALYAGHGEFPRAIFAPGTVDECFELTHLSFDLAERYQTPMFVLSDQHLADAYTAVEPFDLDALPEVAGPVLEPENPKEYKRYALGESCISPRAVPGFSEALVKVDSDEHDEHGHIVEDAPTRVAQNSKRLCKGCGLFEEVVPPSYYGEENPDLLFLCWGSTVGACLEAMELYDGKAAVLHFKQVYPLKEDQFMPFIEAAKNVVCVEGNATGQFGRLLRQETGLGLSSFILRFDGRPMTSAYILKGLESIL
ncbi:2-oxoacid:acceptor oxidoreductase subunit alpha [Salidesulfovibrio brasiliensis]